MSAGNAIFMGLIQGLTEFLPVSSSGHLAIFKILFGIETDTGLLYDVLLHVGTLIAVFAVFWRDIVGIVVEFVRMVIDIVFNFVQFVLGLVRRGDRLRYRKIITSMHRRFVMLVVVATIPTGIIGYLAKDAVESASSVLIVPGICLLITAVLLFVSDRLPGGSKKVKTMTPPDAVVIGVFQGIATLPGISRSGSTIVAGLLCGLDRKFAVKFSFILSIPAILGALVLESGGSSGGEISAGEVGIYFLGMAVAAVVGYICIRLMLVLVSKKKFTYFAVYCTVAGLVAIIGSFFIN